MLLVFRPKVRTLSREQLKRCFLYGLSIIAMNQLFYCALARTPLGIAVTVEFVGLLALALLLSRKPLDFLWTALAVTGILLFGPWTQAHGELSLTGILLAAAAGGGWALYILATNHVTRITPIPDAAALSGFLFLGERLPVLQLLAMACVITASVGSTLTAKR